GSSISHFSKAVHAKPKPSNDGSKGKRGDELDDPPFGLFDATRLHQLLQLFKLPSVVYELGPGEDQAEQARSTSEEREAHACENPDNRVVPTEPQAGVSLLNFGDDFGRELVVQVDETAKRDNTADDSDELVGMPMGHCDLTLPKTTGQALLMKRGESGHRAGWTRERQVLFQVAIAVVAKKSGRISDQRPLE
ncbi:hypothetical protein M407DRAFT_18184, partial [Tulasnella calospora MUT 4182]